MTSLRNATKSFLLTLLLLLTYASAQTTVPPATAERDGQHDFDFEFGKWKVQNRRLVKPLTGSNEWVEFEGKLVARPLWDGRAVMDEYEAESPTGHLDGMTIRTYNQKSGEWSIYWTTTKLGAFALPATVGKFDASGRGEFYDHEQINGRMVFVRFLWVKQNPDLPRWEQAFSVDGGKTWETNWIMTYTRVKE
jgi:hypothetical protein